MRYPDDAEFYYSLLIALATHRDIQDAVVYPPKIIGNNNTLAKVPISYYRVNAGVELIREGLTLCVYPSHAAYDIRDGVPPISKGTTAIEYKSNMLGSTLGVPTYTDEYQVNACYRAVVQLFYRDTAFDATTAIDYEIELFTDKEKSHGEQVSSLQIDPEVNYLQASRINNTITVGIQPGEIILRKWMTLIRGALRDIRSFGDLYLGQPEICCVDYPTTNYIRRAENFVFHTAYILVNYQMFEPGRKPDVDRYPILTPAVQF